MHERQAGPAEGDCLLTPAEAAKLLRVSPRGLFNLRKRGLVRSVKVGNLVRFHASDVLKAITRDPVTPRPA